MTRMLGVTPILRIFDVAAARDFYLGFLEFELRFEHRFGDNFPFYMGVFCDSCALHLTEHFGDATPGAHVRIVAEGVADFCRQLRAKDYRFATTGLPEQQDWGSLEMTLTEPFGNRLTFWEEAVPA